MKSQTLIFAQKSATYFFVLIFAAAVSLQHAWAQPACVSALVDGVAEQNASTDRLYRSLSQGMSGLKATARAKIYLGDRQDLAVLLVHGFIASPFEVDQIGRALNEAGFTVYEPVITGFGGSTFVANHVTRITWRNSVRSSLDLLSACYPTVSVIGFSLGGALTADLALSQNPADQKLKAHAHSIGLLAPFFKTANRFGDALNDFLKTFTDFIPLHHLLAVSGNQDLLLPIMNPEFYNAEMPLNAVAETIELSREVKQNYRKASSDLPTYLAYSEFDQTADWPAMSSFVTAHFPRAERRVFEKSAGIRHQIGVGPTAETIAVDLVKFLGPER